MNPLAARALAAALLLVHVGLVLHGASRHSATFDEVYYAPAGYARLAGGGPDLNPEHPPLVKLLLGASWLGAGLPAPAAVPGFAARDQWAFGPRLLYADPARAEGLLLRARAVVALLSLLLGVAVWAVGRRLGGERAGLLALALYALDPLAIAHGGLATLDLAAAAAVFVAAAAAGAALARGRPARLALAGALAGLALATKATALVLLPVLGLAVAAPLARRGGPAWREVGARAARAALIAAIAAAALALACWPEGLPAWWRALALQRAHSAAGHAAYALGAHRVGGWPWYYPVAWAIKTPLPLLAATLAGCALLLAGLRAAPDRAALVVGPPALLLAAAIGSGVCIGVRQLLPATPFLAVAGGIALDRLAGRRGGRIVALAAPAWLAAAVIAVHPGELAYANEAAGGSARAWRLLSDSNVDWGQDLPALADALRGVPLRRLWLDYFGTALPPAHGVAAYRRVKDPRWYVMAVLPEARRDGPAPAGRELLAVSATSLVDAYGDWTAHAWLRERAPVAWAGRSIAIFDVTGDAEAHRRLAAMAERMTDWRTAAEAWARVAELAPGDAAAALRARRAEALARPRGR